MSIKIVHGSVGYESEPLNRPFGVKGNYIRDLWQTVVGLESASGCRASGIGVQNVFRGDRRVFKEQRPANGNGMMKALTEHAVELATGCEFETPVELLDQVLQPVWDYGKELTGHDDLRLSFVLNALTGLDSAAWKLYARENGIASFDEMIPPVYRNIFSEHHLEVACIPTLSHDIPLEEVVLHAEQDYFFLKVKLGADPDRDGNPEKMLEWDKRRIETIHQALQDYDIPYTDSGKILYYLDGNERYDSKDRLQRLLDYCDKIGAREQIAMIEEPFVPGYNVRVDDLGVRLGVGRNAHSDLDVAERIARGYKAVILNPAGKTLSMCLKMGKVATLAEVPMFCSDSMVGPIQVDLNKTVASRLPCFPGVKIGLLETNGHRLYRNWEKMRSYHPQGFKVWTEIRGGGFHLDDDFYACNGGFFDESAHYSKLVFDN